MVEGDSLFNIDWQAKSLVIPPQMGEGLLHYSLIGVGGGTNNFGLIDHVTLVSSNTSTALVYSNTLADTVADAYVTVNGLAFDTFTLDTSFGSTGSAMITVTGLDSSSTNVVQAWYFTESHNNFNQIVEMYKNYDVDELMRDCNIYIKRTISSDGLTEKIVIRKHTKEQIELYNYLKNIFTDDDTEWYSYYSKKYSLGMDDRDSFYHTPYVIYLESIYNSFDVDGNNKIQINDGYLMFKYFTNTLTKDVVFKHVDIRSSRKSVESIVRYMDEKIGKYGYGQIKSEFFNFDYSSSMDKTGSYLAPFITTIGLYCGSDLVAVAKLGTPIKNTGELPLNILVKWDV